MVNDNILKKRIEFLQASAQGYQSLLTAGVTFDVWTRWCQEFLGAEYPEEFDRVASYVRLNFLSDGSAEPIVYWPEEHFLAGTFSRPFKK